MAWPEAPAPEVGDLALVVGRGADGPLAAFGIVTDTGGVWTSAKGGQIDARLPLSFALGHRLEGGAAVDPEGGLLGLVVADPWRRTLVIPAATVAHSVDILKARGYVARGYLGLKLQRAPARARRTGHQRGGRGHLRPPRPDLSSAISSPHGMANAPARCVRLLAGLDPTRSGTRFALVSSGAGARWMWR